MTTLPRRRVTDRLTVTELGFGGATIGNINRPVDDDVARGAVDAAWSCGVRYFDTAPHYGLGLSERRLGAALAERPRDEYVLSTKVGRLLERNPRPTGSDLDVGGFAVPDDLVRRLDYTADGVRRSLEESLARLGVDRVDVVYVHDPDDPDDLETAIQSGIPALIELREQGVISALGAGMNYVTPLRRIVHECDVDIIMLAGRYTLIDRRGTGLLDECLERGVAVAAAAPFNSGLLARPRPPDDAHFDYGPAAPELLERARALARACERGGTTLPHAAVRFPLGHAAVSTVVVGLRSAANVQDACRWISSPLAAPLDEELRHLDGVAGLAL